MPVRMDQVPALALRPACPSMWRWLGLLMLFLLLGGGGALLFSTAPVSQQPLMFWGLALGIPFLGWSVLSFARVLLYLGQQHAADGWDEAREHDLMQRVRQGRRALEVLSVSLHTALRKPDESSTAQLDALLGGIRALKAQPARRDNVTLRHSRLAGDVNEDLEPALLRTLVENRFNRVGGTQAVPIDVRIISASSQNVAAQIESGEFRSDLFHRLSVFSIAVPPLREMGADKTTLLNHFRDFYAREAKSQPFSLDARAGVSLQMTRLLGLLSGHGWTPNIGPSAVSRYVATGPRYRSGSMPRVS